MIEFLKDWPDALWLLPAFFLMERGKRLLTCGFVLSCLVMLRLQTELFYEIGWRSGYLGLMQSDVFYRGLAVYGGFIALFLLLAYLSPGENKTIHMAASISIFILAFCVSFVIMVL